jgi:triphosphoribosyl-dephospho-CoA synthase
MRLAGIVPTTVAAAERRRWSGIVNAPGPPPSPAPLAAIDIAVAAQLACLLEASAPKPGNVSPGRHFADLRYEDFMASAAAIGEPLSGAGSRPIGETVRLAIEATGRWTRSNSNLGIVLLLVPLSRAAARESGGTGLRAALESVLESTTVDDARNVYAAIRRASPGGLGETDSQDVAGDPSVTLLEAMRLAAGRDGIAREYASAFEVTFEAGAPALVTARNAGLSWDDAVVETFLSLLARAPDTHIVRRSGSARAEEVSRRARGVVEAGGVRTAGGRAAIAAMDRSLRDPPTSANPGTTADLTVAAIFVVLLGGGWPVERRTSS